MARAFAAPHLEYLTLPDRSEHPGGACCMPPTVWRTTASEQWARCCSADYYRATQSPMSFNGIDRKLLNGAYSSFADFGADVEQVLANCHHFISDELPTCIYRDASALQLAYRKAAAEKPSSQALEVDTCNMPGPPQKTLSASAQNPIEQAPICKYSLLDKPKPLSSKKKASRNPTCTLPLRIQIWSHWLKPCRMLQNRLLSNALCRAHARLEGQTCSHAEIYLF
jgi:hypothetical protein